MRERASGGIRRLRGGIEFERLLKVVETGGFRARGRLNRSRVVVEFGVARPDLERFLDLEAGGVELTVRIKGPGIGFERPDIVATVDFQAG